MDGKESKLNPHKARTLWRYNPKTGFLRWHQSGKGRKLNKPAGFLNSGGYLLVGYGGEIYQVSRLIWLMQTGSWPYYQIDHKNGNRSDNRWKNIREATVSQNNQNRRGGNGVSKLKGVHWVAQYECWKAAIKLPTKLLFLGHFTNKKRAHAAYMRAAKQYFGDFARAR